MQEFVAYKGSQFTIEWYYDANGKSDVFEYYESLDFPQKRKIIMLFKKMSDFGRIRDITKFRNEGNKIYAFKPKPDRFLSFFYTGSKIIVTNAFVKKSDKLPDEEKERALKRRQDYIRREQEGTYYDDI